MKYVILIYHNPAARQIWESFSDEQKAEGYGVYAALNEDLMSSGEMIVSEALADPAMAKRVTVRDGQIMASDGPFAEVKEHLTGFYLVECDSQERAIEVAARIPEAAISEGRIEVRPVLDLSGMEM